MARERLYLFDTTLRDGAQTNGVDFTLDDKLALAGMLDELGIDYVEGGYPGANPLDTELFAQGTQARHHLHRLRHDAAARPLDLERSRAWRRCSTPRPTPSASSRSPGTITCAVALETTEEENLASIRDSVRAAKAKGREVLLDCEHFFDGYKANPKYALACAKAAYDEGARWVVLCDTNGGALPHEVEEIVGEVVQARSRATMSASTPITTPSRRWRIRSPRCAPARARSRARSTGSASAAATPTSSRSSRR